MEEVFLEASLKDFLDLASGLLEVLDLDLHLVL